jgi:outer membrane receptor protein involved in Fe transport
VIGLLLAPAAIAATGLPGTIRGRVFDAETGAPLEGATVILVFPDPGDGSEPRQEVTTTGPAGDYEFDAVPAGAYALSFVKSGYRASSVTDFEVVAARDNVADFPMPPAPVAAGGEVLELEAYVVEASVVGELMAGLELRLESDQLLNVLSAEDLSKFAAGDVAEALQRVAGVNVQEGEFAIIRGLEDRYSATTFNGAPVPSPDPDRQSVQLDLFPSDIVTNLVLAKSFDASSPSNGSAGSIDIQTTNYPDELEFKVSLGTGFNEEARKRFLRYDQGSPMGVEADPVDVIESDVGATFGGRRALLGRELRFRGIVNHEVDYDSAKGFQEGREPRVARILETTGGTFVTRSGSLAFGDLLLSDGRYDQIISERTEQLTSFFGLGVDLDQEGKHRVDASIFYTKKKQETVQLRENGYFPGYDYSSLIATSQDIEEDLFQDLFVQADEVATNSSALAGSETSLRSLQTDSPGRGALWFANFGQSRSFDRKRDLQVYQLNGTHEFDLWEGLDVTWAANYAKTTQKENVLGTGFTYEPCGYSGQLPCEGGGTQVGIPTVFPVRVSDLGDDGRFIASGATGSQVESRVDVDESQWFGRMDFDQALAPIDRVDLEVKGGVWWEKSNRTANAFFRETFTRDTSSQFFVANETLNGLGRTLFSQLDPPSSSRDSDNLASREVWAGHVSLKATVWDDVDLIGGVRVEDFYMDSHSDPFTGEFAFDRPSTFPPAYVFFDRLDNAAFGEVLPFQDPTTLTFNDQILGINSRVNPDTGFVDFLTQGQILGQVNGKIDEVYALPFASIAYRPWDGVTLQATYSETRARPSFREMGYYVSVEPGTDDQAVGNPQLELSEIKNFDGRVEYVFGDRGDLFAFSAYYKTIENPIESIVLRNPLDFESTSLALFKTWFNNPDVARLWGIEVEMRKSFDFVRLLGVDFPGIDAFDYLSIGGNFSWIEAKVDRSPIELQRAQPFFSVAPGDSQLVSGLDSSRRLFGQPEWIANADLSFDHPDWGTRVTLAVFAISDVLDAVGSVALGRSSEDTTFELDRYNDEYYQLDLVMSQRIWGGLSAKVSIKNLTDSTRRIVYDDDLTRGKFEERKYKKGRDYSFALSYTQEF